MKPDDISTEKAYTNELVKHGELITGLVADLLRENRKQANKIVWLESALVGLVLFGSWLVFGFNEDLKILEIVVHNLRIKG